MDIFWLFFMLSALQPIMKVIGSVAEAADCPD